MKIINTRKKKSSQGKAQNIKIWEDISLENFQFWGGAKDNAKKLSSSELDSLESQLEELYPDGMSDTDLNDTMWFSFAEICQWVGHAVDVSVELVDDKIVVSVLEENENGGYPQYTYNASNYDSIDEVIDELQSDEGYIVDTVEGREEAERDLEKFKEAQEETENSEMKSKNSNADIVNIAKGISNLANKIERNAAAEFRNRDIEKATDLLISVEATMKSVLDMYDVEFENAGLDEIELEF